MPTPLKLLHGERRSERLNRDAPRPAGTFPTMPRDLTEGAARVWRRTARAMRGTHVISAVDAPLLRMYVEAVDRYETAAHLLHQSGPLVKGARGGDLVKNPLHQVVRDNVLLARNLARELGLSPASREGIRTPRVEDDEFEGWLSGVGS